MGDRDVVSTIDKSSKNAVADEQLVLHQGLIVLFIFDRKIAKERGDGVSITQSDGSRTLLHAFCAEHYFTRFSNGQTASITFLDASVRWLLSKRIDLALAATNLLDETDYRYTSFGSLSESLYSFSIRPRNIIIKMQIKI